MVLRAGSRAPAARVSAMAAPARVNIPDPVSCQLTGWPEREIVGERLGGPGPVQDTVPPQRHQKG